MRILMLNYEFPPIGGGASPVSKDLARELVEQGNAVTVVTMAYKDLPHIEKTEGIKVHRVKCIRSKAFVCHPWEQLSYIVMAWFYIRRMMKHEQFDIVHAHFIIPTGELARWIKKRYKIPYIITAHGSDVMGYNQKRFKILHKILLPAWKKIVNEAQDVVAPSEFLLGLMRKQLPNNHYTLIPNGVDTGKFQALPKKKQILVMCRLQEPKGVQTVIKATARLKDLGEWKLCIAGDGPYLPVLKNLVKELDLESCVEFKGWVENKSEQHLQLVGESSIYISASRFENSPVSVLEALSAGCQPLLSDIAAHRALVDDEDRLFEVDNEIELAEKMNNQIKIIENREDVHICQWKPLDWNEVAVQYVQLYNIYKDE